MAKKKAISYRSFCPDDIAAIRMLLKKTALYFSPIDDHLEWYEDKWRHDPSSLMVAHDNKKLVGMIMFTFDPLLSVVAHLAVGPRYQRRGIGRELLKRALQQIEAKGGHYVAGYIIHSNTASLKLCESLGFERFAQPLTAVLRVLG